MENKLYICSVPFLSLDYQHVIDFSSLESQINFFKNKSIVSFNQKSSVDGERLEISVPYGMSELKLADYLMAYNTNEDKYYFYFINSKRYKTEKVTIIEIILDVWNTYLFNVTLLESYVERCHVPRWEGDIPTKNNVDEGLPLGDYEQAEVETVAEYTHGLLIASTSPLGKINEYSPPQTGGSNGGISPSMASIPSKRGYRFIKGFEGFGANPYRVTGEVADTVGYGIREDYQKHYFDKLKPFPCSEMLASEVYGEMLLNQFAKQVGARLTADGYNLEEYPIHIFDVWVSHSMNAGLGGWGGGRPYSLYRSGASNEEVAEAIRNWAITGEGGTVLPGLVARREAEAKIFLEGVYNMRDIVKINSDGSISGIVTDNNGNGHIPSIFKGDL